MSNPPPKSSIGIFPGDHIGTSHPKFDELNTHIFYVIRHIKIADIALFQFLSSRDQILFDSTSTEFKSLNEEIFSFSFIGNIHMIYKVTSMF